jgi:hypothetical protein
MQLRHVVIPAAVPAANQGAGHIFITGYLFETCARELSIFCVPLCLVPCRHTRSAQLEADKQTSSLHDLVGRAIKLNWTWESIIDLVSSTLG